MGIEFLFKLVLIAEFSAFSILRILYYQRARKAGRRTVIEESRSYSILLSVLICYEVATFFLYLISPPALAWARIPMGMWLRAAGAAVGVLALLLFTWVHHSLGHNFSMTLRISDEHSLVTAGPYRAVRHPMYTAFGMLHVSVFFLTANWFIGLTWMAGLVAIIALRVRREEAMMLERFGEEYASYVTRTGRFLPPLRRTRTARRQGR
jgi:protein-S-isoprenylcysteine O-methyltransferase Ste14